MSLVKVDVGGGRMVAGYAYGKTVIVPRRGAKPLIIKRKGLPKC
jgi:hypothetical protein